MSTFQGSVEKIFEKSIKTRRGQMPVYSMKIDGQDDWFDLGFDKPDVVEQDYVQFDADKNDRGYWKVGKGAIVKIERPKDEPKSQAAGGGTGEVMANNGVTSYEKELRYNYRFSYGVASEFALAALQAGFLPTNGGATKAKKAATMEDVEQFIDERAAKIFARCWSIEELEGILDSAVGVDAEEVAPGPGPDSEGSED